MPLGQESQNLSPSTLRCLDLFGDAQKFFEVFSPRNITKCSRIPDRCINGNAPTLQVAEQAYGQNKMVAWLMVQLDYINNMAGTDKKMSETQIEVMAMNILTNDDFRSLKASDILLFCHQFINGKYGHFYGAICPQFIGNSLYKYIEWKRAELAQIHLKEEKERHDRVDYSNCVTYEEYKRLKQLKDKEKKQ